MTEMTEFLMHFYRMAEEDAREVIADLRDTKSLASLAGCYCAARAVIAPTPPTTSTVSVAGTASQ